MSIESAASEIAFLIPSSDLRTILTSHRETDQSVVALPGVAVAGEATAETIAESVKALLGVSTPILRITALEWSAGNPPTSVLVELEPRDVVAPAHHGWTEIRSLENARIHPPEAREALARWIAERAAGPSTLRPVWSRQGWFARASEWMVERLAEAGIPATAVPRIHYMWGLSVVLRAETTAGPAYLKCPAAIFRHEAALTRALAHRVPGFVPVVIAIEPTEGWLLMRDLGQRFLGDQPADHWARGLEVHATIQRALVGSADELVGAGAPSRGLDALAADIPAMVEHPLLAASLTSDERARLDAALPVVVDACRRLDDLGPSATLIHGDLHPWNIAVRVDGFVVFDWSDASIGHPFVDLATYVIRTDDIEARRAMRSAYLARWSEDLPPDRLAVAGDLALTVGAFYQVATYLALLPTLDPDDRIPLNSALANWARRGLGYFDRGIEFVWKPPT
jgi:Phosphotransferase enzyme family